MGSISETVKYDVILIGAGFGGLTMLPRLVLLSAQQSPQMLLTVVQPERLGFECEDL